MTDATPGAAQKHRERARATAAELMRFVRGAQGMTQDERAWYVDRATPIIAAALSRVEQEARTVREDEVAALRAERDALAEAAMRLLEVESSPGPAGRHFQAVALLRAALRRAGVDPAISRDRWFRVEGAAKETSDG